MIQISLERYAGFRYIQKEAGNFLSKTSRF